MDFSLRNALVNGLAPFDTNERGIEHLSALKNLQCCEQALRPIPEFVSPPAGSGAVTGWPNSHIERQGSLVMSFGADSVQEIDEVSLNVTSLSIYKSSDETSVPSPDLAGYWHLSGFRNNFVATNGKDMLCRTATAGESISTGAAVIHGSSDSASQGSWNTVCNYANRLVLAGPDASKPFFSGGEFTELFSVWRDYTPDNLLVSDKDAIAGNYLFIGDAGGGDSDVPLDAQLASIGVFGAQTYNTKWRPWLFGLLERGASTFYPVYNGGTILAVKQHFGDLIVYTDQGVSKLRYGPQPFQGGEILGFSEEILLSDGLAGRGALAGTAREHLFVTKQGEVYMLGERAANYRWAKPYGGGLYRLGYATSAGVGGLSLDNSLIVSFDEEQQHYWFSDGTDTRLLTRTGLCSVPRTMPTSVVRLPGQDGLIAMAANGADDEVELKTQIFDGADGDRRTVWSIGTIELSTTDTSSGWTAQVEARMDKGGSFKSYPPVVADSRGISRVSAPGVDFRVTLTADDDGVDLANANFIEGRGKPSMRKWLDAS